MSAAYITLPACTVHAADTGTGAAPAHAQVQLTTYELEVGFLTDSTIAPLEADAEVRMTIKLRDRFGATTGLGLPILGARIWNPNGQYNEESGTAARYTFSSQLIGDLLAADMSTAAYRVYHVEIEWQLPGSSELFKSLPFELTIHSAVGVPGDVVDVTPVDPRVIHVSTGYASLAARGYQAFATWQLAYAAAFTQDPPLSASAPVMILGQVGDFGGLVLDGENDPTGLVIRGQGDNLTTLAGISGTLAGIASARLDIESLLVDGGVNIQAGAALTIANKDVTYDGNLIVAGKTGDPGGIVGVVEEGEQHGDNGDPCNLTIIGAAAVTGNLTLKGGQGGTGGDGGPPFGLDGLDAGDGGDGSDAGTLTVGAQIHVAGTVTAVGGLPGAGGTGGAPAGEPGVAGDDGDDGDAGNDGTPVFASWTGLGSVGSTNGQQLTWNSTAKAWEPGAA